MLALKFIFEITRLLSSSKSNGFYTFRYGPRLDHFLIRMNDRSDVDSCFVAQLTLGWNFSGLYLLAVD